MSPISQTEFDRILMDASAHYHDPENVAKDDRLTREQKIKILKQWAYDVHEMEVAQEENMQPKDSDELILDQVLRVLHEVENK
jgi:hypothetical protein